MNISTDELIRNIKIASDINSFASQNRDEFLSEAPHLYIKRKMEERCRKPSEVFSAAALDYSYGYRIISGERIPGRNTIIRLILAMQLTIDDAQHTLRLFGLARLDPRCYRDATILFSISKGYTLAQTAAMLSEFGEAEL